MDDFLIYFGYAILVINLILYTFSFFLRGKANVFFVSYLGFTFLVQLGMELLYHFKMNNLLLMNLFFIGQMILLGLFYRSLFTIQSQKNVVVGGIFIALIIFTVQLYFDPNLLFKFNLLEITITSLLIVVFALIHFYNMLTDHKQYYYITIGVIIYLLGATVLLLVGNLTTGLSKEVRYLSWTLNALLVIVYYLVVLLEWKISFYRNTIETK